MWPGWVELAMGIWLILAPFVMNYGGTPYWHDILVGLAAVFLGLLALAGKTIRVAETCMALGVWLLIGPYLLGFADVASAVGNDLAVGVILLVTGLTVHLSRTRRTQ